MHGLVDAFIDCMHGCMCACMGWAATFGSIFEHVALLLWCHHSEQRQHQHPRTATAHAVAIVISCPVTVSKQSKRKVTSKNGVKKGEELGLMSGYEWSVLYWLH